MNKAADHNAVAILMLLVISAAMAMSECKKASGIEARLELTSYFPSEAQDERSIWLNQAVAMAESADGRFYVCNNQEKTVSIFDRNGRFIRKFGQPGQGPGDFQMIQKIICDTGAIWIMDSMKQEIGLYDPDGSYVRHIKLFKSYQDIWISPDKRIFAVPRPRAGSNLVDVIDDTGKFLYSFGEPVKFSGSFSNNILNSAKIAGDGRSIVLLFVSYPLARKYGRDGSLIKEWSFDEIPEVNEKGQENIERLRNYNPGRTGYSRIFEAVESKNGSWYFLRNRKSGIDIIKTDDEFRLRRIYRYEVTDDSGYYAMDMEIETAPAERFYILRWVPMSRVEVFSPKE
jgi:hypothetical protein